MASITEDSRERSPFFTACFTGVVGQSRKQFKRSTGTTSRKLAQRIADELEEAAQGKRTTEEIKTFLAGIKDDLRAQRAARKAFEHALRATTGAGLGTRTARGYITEWLQANSSNLEPATFAKYQKTADRFLESLGGAADSDMAAIQADAVAHYRNTEAKRVSKSTANVNLKIVRAFFGEAERDGVVPRNIARFVRTLKDTNAERARRPFTLDELETVLGHCDDEWRSLVIFGLYTGARLGDLARLTWQAVDLEQRTINFVSRKTGKPIHLPMAAPLEDHVATLPAGEDPKEPLHPRAFAIVTRHGRVGMLSNQFGEILAHAGLASSRTHQAKQGGTGRSGRRQASELSFHALRHTAISLLKNAGVSDAVARAIAGHSSAAVNRLYTHIEDGTKLDALNKLPTVRPKARKPNGEEKE